MIQKFNPQKIADAFAHIEDMWVILTVDQEIDNGTLIGLPNPYIIPSREDHNGFTFQEMYYWDSYFTMCGLLKMGHDELAEGMLENIIYLYKKFHIVPNASRFYMCGRSQPPVMTSMIFDIFNALEKTDSWLRERIEVAEKEYWNVWLGDKQPNIRLSDNGLSRYYDVNVLHDMAEAESGWDMTTRFAGKCLDYNPIDLNCLLYVYERDFMRAYKIFGDNEATDIWRARAEKRAETINKLMWDEPSGFYFDYNFVLAKNSAVKSLASYFALWAGIATPMQAEQLANNLTDFIHAGGLATTSKPDEYDPRDISKQWAYPNGWAPLHYIVCEGLSNYGYGELAEQVARLWIGNNLNYFENHKVFREAYNVVVPSDKPVEGVYPSQVGFGWTNAVFVYLAKKYLSPEETALI